MDNKTIFVVEYDNVILEEPRYLVNSKKVSCSKAKISCSEANMHEVLGTMTVINRLAESIGHGAKSKLGKPCKAMVQVRNRGDGSNVLVVSTKKDLSAMEYNVKKIQQIRDRFVDDGFATIDISEPPMSIMLRDCTPAVLKGFVDYLQDLRKGTGKARSSLSASGADKNTPNPQSRKVEEKCESRKGSGTLKRPRSPELSKTAKDNAKRHLQSTSVCVKKRENYPKEFLATLDRIKIEGIGLKKIDKRMLRLKCLTVLDLEGNQIGVVHELIKLSCKLKSLNLSKNMISKLPDDFFSHAPFEELNFLDISKNQLAKIPSSFTSLRLLATGKLQDNFITSIPYNLKGMKSLRMLNICNNALSFVPSTVMLLSLTGLDLSGNPAVQTKMTGNKIDYVGYAVLPTLFEKCCDVLMNMPEVERCLSTRNSAALPWPSIVSSYLDAGKFCMECFQKSLRFKITTTSVLTRNLCEGEMSRCLVSPVSDCIVKKILCYKCDTGAPRPCSLAYVREAFRI